VSYLLYSSYSACARSLVTISRRGDPSTGSGEVEELVQGLGLGRDKKDIQGLLLDERENSSEAWPWMRWRTPLKGRDGGLEGG